MVSVLSAGARSAAPAQASARRVGRPLSAVRSRVYLPSFSIVAVAAALVAIGWADRWGGS